MVFCFLVQWSVSHLWLPIALWSQLGFLQTSDHRLCLTLLHVFFILWPILRDKGSLWQKLLMVDGRREGWQNLQCASRLMLKSGFLSLPLDKQISWPKQWSMKQGCVLHWQGRKERTGNGGGFVINATTYHSVWNILTMWCTSIWRNITL